MGPDLSAPGRTQRCPSCGAALRPEAPWCTLCYADLRPPAQKPEPEPAAPAPVAPLSAPLLGVDPLTAPLTALPAGLVPAAGGATWPCLACGAANPLGNDTCTSCGTAFLGGLRDELAMKIPGIGDVARLDRQQRYLLAGLVVLVFVGLTVVLGLL